MILTLRDTHQYTLLEDLQGTSWKHPPIGDQIYEVTVVDGSGRIVTYREDIVEFRWSLNGDPISTKTIEGVQAKAIFDAVR